MVDVKVCSKCGTSIPGQAIIDGQAKLINGQLLCAQCAARPAAAAARPPGPITLDLDEATAPPPVAPAQAEAAGEEAIDLEGAGEGHEEITIFGGGTGAREEVEYQRKPTTSGTGAIRVKTFNTKLSRAAFEVLDEQINQWLDETGYEVKHVTANVGDIHGKTSIEPHLIINIWY